MYNGMHKQDEMEGSTYVLFTKTKTAPKSTLINLTNESEQAMSIFGSKKKEPTSPLLMDDEEVQEQLGEPVNYNTVVDWLVGLSDEDYTKVCKVAEIYRDANVKATEALGVENQPSTSIFPPEPVEGDVKDPQTAEDISDDLLDDTDLGNWLEEDEPEKVEVKVNKK